MPTLVHITSRSSVSSIRKAGIKPGKRHGVVYFMPRCCGYYMSNQWCRELKRNGIAVFSAVYFRLPSHTLVWHGHFNSMHKEEELGQAIHEFYKMDDQLGYEFFVEMKIPTNAIMRTKDIPKPMGWRYYPSSHGKKPCFCPACSIPGEYGQSKQASEWRLQNEERKMSVSHAKEAISNSSDPYEVLNAVEMFIGKTRRTDPSFLFDALERDDELEEIVLTAVGCFAHPRAKEFLSKYQSEDPDIQELIIGLLSKRGWD